MFFVLRDAATGNITNNANVSVASDGTITAANIPNPGGCATLSLTATDNSSFTTGNSVKIPYDASTVTGLANDITVANSAFVVHKSGYYYLSGSVTRIDNAQAAPWSERIDIMQNGSNVATFYNEKLAASVATLDSITFSVLLQTVPDDTIAVNFFQGSGDTISMSGVALPNKVTFAQLMFVASTVIP